LPAGQRQKATQLIGDISRKWNKMSAEEQIAATDPLLADIEELREMKKLAVRNVPLESFQDASSSLKTLEKEVCFELLYYLSLAH